MAHENIPSDEPPYFTGKRSLNNYTVKTNNPYTDGSGRAEIRTTDSVGFSASPEVAAALTPGVEFQMETQGFSQITGFKVNGEWIERKSDADLLAAHEAFVADLQKRNEKRLAENEQDYHDRQDKLPEWIRVRLESFHLSGGKRFRLEGWAYELIIAELAVMYADMGLPLIKDFNQFDSVDSEEIREYARINGTSGNQHGVAIALAKAHLSDPEWSTEGTVSGLSPLTGDPDYSGKNKVSK